MTHAKLAEWCRMVHWLTRVCGCGYGCARTLGVMLAYRAHHNFGLMLLARRWLALGARRRSCEMVAKAFSLAARSNLPMDQLLDARATEELDACSMGFLSPQLFTQAASQQQIVGMRMSVDEFPPDMVSDGRKTPQTLSEGWVIGREHDRGVERYFLSPAFERDIASLDEIIETYKSVQDRTHKPLIEHVIPESHAPEVSRAIGEQVT